MDGVNKTLYIPLYGKAFVSKKNIIIRDKRAEEIWSREGFKLKGKSKSKWLAYYLAMRASVYDEWLEKEIKLCPNAVVIHIGCGLDSRIERVSAKAARWYDIDFFEVIAERRKYYVEDNYYRMLEADMRNDRWREHIDANQDAIIILEGVSMYFEPKELTSLLANLSNHFSSVKILMDCYTKKAARLSKYKNPINDVGVTTVYGYDSPSKIVEGLGLELISEHNMTPQKYVNQLRGAEKFMFKRLFAGKFAKSLYKMYEYKKA